MYWSKYILPSSLLYFMTLLTSFKAVEKFSEVDKKLEKISSSFDLKSVERKPRDSTQLHGSKSMVDDHIHARLQKLNIPEYDPILDTMIQKEKLKNELKPTDDDDGDDDDDDDNDDDDDDGDDNKDQNLKIMSLPMQIYAQSNTVSKLLTNNKKRHYGSLRSSRENTKQGTEHQSNALKASKMSYGFFYDIPDSNWDLLIDIYEDQKQNQHRPNAMQSAAAPQFYQENWEPNFSCQFERRIGIMGDGGKWVCDPHRIKALSKTRKTSSGEDDPCLIYSIGSEGDFSFEHGIMDMLGEDECEIHTFEVNDMSQIMFKQTSAEEWRKTAKVNTHFGWGLISSKKQPQRGYKTLSKIIKKLGHEGRTIDIFKIDCEHCEWSTYKDWIDAPALIHQVLVEVHDNTKKTNKLFEAMQNAGYAIFHKEPNIQYGGGVCVEYSFLKLDLSAS